MPDTTSPDRTPRSSAAGAPLGWEPPAPEVLQEMLPQYEITALLGRGGMGAVYKGRQVHLDRAVAIKILPPGLDETDATYSERFRNEALAMAKLNHPGIVAVYDFGTTSNGMLYIVMEYVDGTDVAQMMAQQKRLPAAHAMAITAHVCDALKYAHERGIVHRDIKPANIMVGYDGVVKVADFGLAKMSQGGQTTGMTQSGLAMGTMHYIAPEALTLGVSVDQRADIYAMGVMLYHMLTGGLPQGMFELPSQQVPGLDPRYDGIISRALRNDRELRYQSVVELRRDLDAILSKPVVKVDAQARQAPAALNTMARPQRPPQWQAPPRPARNGNLGFWVPMGCVAAACVAAYVWLGPAERKTVQRIEGETLKVLSVTRGKAEPQGMTDYHAGVWSGGAQLLWLDGEEGDVLTLQFPVAEAGRQRVKAVLSAAGDYGVAAVSLDGRPVPGSPFDQQAEEVVVSDLLDWGVHELKAGDHRLEIKLVGTHGREVIQKRPPFLFGLDCLQLEPLVVKDTPAAPGTDVALTARPSASACERTDDVKHLNSGAETPGQKSGDAALPRFSWHPHKGSMEWAQYEWERPQVVDECRVFWFDDSAARGGCKLPAFWRLLYRDEHGAWVPVVAAAAMPDAVADDWNVVSFPAVRTTGLRLSVQCESDWSAGVCHWKVLAAAAGAKGETRQREHPELFLGDLTPLHWHVGWQRYAACRLPEGRYAEEGRLMVAGKPCREYLWAHATSRLEFAIPAGYTRFSATGIGFKKDGQDPRRGSWTYAIEVDGKTLFASEELKTYPNKELAMEVSFPAGAKRLVLIADNAGDGAADHAFWAYPRLSADGAAAVSQADARPPAVAAAPASVPKPVFTNSLGMQFVPVAGTQVLMCIHETRNQDYRAYAAAVKGVNPSPIFSDKSPADQEADHPIRNVRYIDAAGFCEWLSQKEGRKYRLPTDEEWSLAMGVGPAEKRVAGDTPETLTRRPIQEFPWGSSQWPPPPGFGNYADTAWKAAFPNQPSFIEGYTDGFPTTAPVMSFPPNAQGLYDMSGNVAEWVQDWWNAQQKDRTYRGGYYGSREKRDLQPSSRGHHAPTASYSNGNQGFRCVLEGAGMEK